MRWIATKDADESTECERQIASGARLQHRCQREREGRQSERTEVRQARLDRRCVHGEESVAFSGSIGVELDSEGSIVSTCTEDVTSLINSSVTQIPVSAHSGSPTG